MANKKDKKEVKEEGHDNARLELTEGDTSGFKSSAKKTPPASKPRERSGGQIVVDCV